MIATNTTTTTNQIANVATADAYEDPMLDNVGGSFGILIPVLVQPDTNYGEAMAAFEELTTKINEYLRNLRIPTQQIEYISF